MESFITTIKKDLSDSYSDKYNDLLRELEICNNMDILYFRELITHLLNYRMSISRKILRRRKQQFKEYEEWTKDLTRETNNGKGLLTYIPAASQTDATMYLSFLSDILQYSKYDSSLLQTQDAKNFVCDSKMLFYDDTCNGLNTLATVEVILKTVRNSQCHSRYVYCDFSSPQEYFNEIDEKMPSFLPDDQDSNYKLYFVDKPCEKATINRVVTVQYIDLIPALKIFLTSVFQQFV